ncbi:MAG TPA: CotH kinase family protein [Verrucomicrobiae bacterium]
MCRSRLSRVFTFVLFVVANFVASAATNEPGADIFAPNAPVLRIKVEIPNTGWRSLQHDARKPVPATVREGENVYSNVMVHLKGAVGSFRDISSNPSLTLSFGKSDPNQRFHGLHKIHLNNSVQDGSQTTYLITSMMFNEANVPAARVTNARFWLNGRDLGMYVVVEGFTKDFLRRYFKDTKGNLYDGGFCQDIDSNLERDSGEGDDTKADLKAVVRAANFPDRTQRWEKLKKVVDVDRFVDYMVLETFMWDWDGYPAKANNYRVYHDPSTDKVTFIPHGMDQMFWEPQGHVWRPLAGGMVARAIMETPEGAKLYHDRVQPVFEKAFRIDEVTNRIDQLTERNRKAAQEVGRGFANNWEGNVHEVRRRIVERWAFIKNQIENEPKPMDFSKPVFVKNWRQQIEMGGARLDQPQIEGKPSLHIAANGQSTASWRSSLMLDPGRYRFEAMARTAKLNATRDSKGEGAGIRISGSNQPRRNSVAGDAGWTKLQYDFEVQGAQSEVVLVCESRANRGEVWFDASSLKLEKLR